MLENDVIADYAVRWKAYNELWYGTRRKRRIFIL